MAAYRDVSLWFDELGDVTPRPPLTGDADADVAVVGAGYTGLWTAYYLQRLDPALRIVLLEAEVAGFGASGRNGGWCSALFPVSATRLAAEHGPAAAREQYRAMRESVTEIAEICAKESIEADVATGGTVVVARSPAQLDRAREEVAESDEFGLGTRLLDAAEARARLAATGVLGATYTPHCAAIQPAKLVRGLADVVERSGATIFERTRATGVAPGVVTTEQGTVRAGTVVRATEGWTSQLPGSRRTVVPVYSLVVATEPLPDAVWDEIGLRDRETFADHRHLVIYGQRTATNRLVFGGRGAPYHFGSRSRADYDRVPRVFAMLERTLHELFPVLRGYAITHRWGGPLGIARDWHASVGLERSDAGSLAWAGGYVGDGVSTTNLAGRTLAALLTGRDTFLTRLPWVGPRSRAWEPEPLRWLGANAALQAMTWADRAERRGDRPSRVAGLVDRVLGR